MPTTMLYFFLLALFAGLSSFFGLTLAVIAIKKEVKNIRILLEKIKAP
jgi:hypothetical protein